MGMEWRNRNTIFFFFFKSKLEVKSNERGKEESKNMTAISEKYVNETAKNK